MSELEFPGAASPFAACVKSVVALLLVAMMALSCAGCASHGNAAPMAQALAAAGQAQPAAPAEPQAEREYQLSVGDVLDIKFFYNSELNENVTIRPDGRISLQLIGDVTASNLLPSQLKEQLTAKYGTMLRHPELTIIVRKYTAQKIYVGGQVMVPGVVPFEGRVTALQAVINSGGFKFGAQKDKVAVLRNTAPNTFAYFTLDLNAELEKAEASPFYLEPADVVFVPQTGVNELAQYFKENINEIFPFWKNSSFSFPFYYQLNPQTTPVFVNQK